MKKCSYLFLTVCVIVMGFSACVQEEAEEPHARVRRSRLSVEEARAFFESDARRQLTRAAADGSVLGVFEVGVPVPDWENAQASSNAQIACVDIPARTGREFRIMRKRSDGTMSEVPAYGKLLVVRSEETGEMATYMRFLVPDELYDASYGCDLSEFFVNCAGRDDYSGLEFYTTLDGAVAAAARYAEGMLVESIFVGDRHFSHADRLYRLRCLMRGIHISRRAAGVTRGESDWFDFGGRDCFYDSTGALYFVVRFNNVSYATQDFDGTLGPCVNGKALGGGNGGGGGGGDDGGGGGGGGGGSSDPFGPPKGPDPIGTPDLPPYPGKGGDGGPSKPNLPNNDDRTKPDVPILPDFTEPRPTVPVVNPLPDKLLCPKCRRDPCICEREVDCEELAPEAGDNSVKMTSLYNQAAALPNFSEFLKATDGASIEYGTTGYTDGQGNFHTTHPYTDNKPHSVKYREKKGYDNITMFHNHPSGNACSIVDIEQLIYLNELFHSFQSMYVRVEGRVFVIHIYDVEMMSKFKDSGDYECMKGQYSSAFSRLLNAGYDTATAHLYAVAFMLQQLNTGIAILSKSDGEHVFHQHRTMGKNPDECDLPTIMQILKCL